MSNEDDRPLTVLRNIGATSAAWLQAVGIHTVADLEQVGVVGAYRRIVAQGQRPSINLLYALQAGLLGIHWTDLPLELRQELRTQAVDDVSL